MSKEQVLGRVADDLERGHTHVALQRLASLTVAYPDDLDVRERRAAVCRQVGNLSEAGRWAFLSESATAAELAAFDRRFRDPWHALRALRLASDPEPRLGPAARARLRELVGAASAAADAPVVWSEFGPHADRGGDGGAVAALACGGLVLLVLSFLAMSIVGIVVTVRWLG